MAANQFVIENAVWSRPDDNASAGIDPLGCSFPAKRLASLSVPMAKNDTKLTGAGSLTDLFLEQIRIPRANAAFSGGGNRRTKTRICATEHSHPNSLTLEAGRRGGSAQVRAAPDRDYARIA